VLFWAVTQRVAVNTNRCFVTTYRSHPQVNPEDGTDSLSRRVGKRLSEVSWIVTRDAQKTNLVFRLTDESIQSIQSVQSATGRRGLRISGSNAGYAMFRGSVKGTGYQFHSPVSHSLPFPYDNVCHHISTGVYYLPCNNPEDRSSHCLL